MKRKNMILILLMGLLLCAGCGDSEQKENIQEVSIEAEDTEKNAEDGKKEMAQDEVAETEMDETEDNKEDNTEDNTEEVIAVSSEKKKETSISASSEKKKETSVSKSSEKNAEDSKTPASGNTSESKEDSKAPASGNTSESTADNSVPEQPAVLPHVHCWIHREATGHYETVVVQEAWEEEVPAYDNVAYSICNVCGADITGNTVEHTNAHLSAYEGGGYHTEWRYEQVGTKTVHHDAVTEEQWVQDTPAHDECPGCGATR